MSKTYCFNCYELTEDYFEDNGDCYCLKCQAFKCEKEKNKVI